MLCLIAVPDDAVRSPKKAAFNPLDEAYKPLGRSL